MNRKELSAKAKAISAILQVGKNGITESFVEELCRAAKKRGLVKVKMLQSAGDLDLKAIAKDIAANNGLMVISVVGNTVVFFDPKAPVKKQ